MQRQRNGAAAKLHTPCRGGSQPPEANATERPVKWYSPKSTEFVGVANLATRAAQPLAGGYEPPLPGAVETVSLQQPTKCTPRGGAKGTSCQRVAKLATPTGCGGSRGVGGEYLTRLYHFSRQISPGFVKKAESHKKYQNCQFQFVNVAAIIKAYTGGTSP